jgi:hypothetical protein
MSGVAVIEKKLSEAYVAEKAKNPYAVGMAQAMKSTGDTPPLKKSTITKAHDIAKKVDEVTTRQVKDFHDVLGKQADIEPAVKKFDADAGNRRKFNKAHDAIVQHDIAATNYDRKYRDDNKDKKKVDENGMPMDTNPKNAAWDADANAKQRARIAREKQKIGMQRKISGQDTGLPPAVKEGQGEECTTCDGTGEGQHGDTKCHACNGRGIRFNRDDDDSDRADYENDAARDSKFDEDTAAVKYGVFSKGGSIGSQRFKDDPLKTFDSKEEAIADAKRRRSGLSKGERGYYRMGYVVKPIKGVAEGFADMEADVKRRDAERRSGKKATATGVKHHGKYGTEYQGDADEEQAAAKAADKGPKKRGRPAKGLAKPKPAADEKKGRGRPKKAADPTYSGAKDLQNFMVGNLPKGKQAKGKVYKMDESRMLDEAGQHLDHILNRFKHEVRKFEETGDLDQDSDLYHALHDYYKETGSLPYDIEKGRGVVSTLTWVADKLDDHLGISEELAPAGMAQAFKPGDRVLYMGTFATVITCDGETCGIKMDKHPGTMMVPVSQIKKPSYDESSSVPAQDTGKKDFFHNPAVPDNEQLPATPKEIELNELAKLAGLTTETKAKPDYIDLDKDGNKKEPMKSAAQDAEDDDHDYANRLDDEQMDENVPVHKHIDGPTVPGWTAPAADEFDDVCPECDGEGCPECYGDEHRDRAHDHARGMERESAIREAQEMINFMRNAGLDTSRAESALAEAYKYGDTDVEEAPEYANSPDEEIQNVDAITRQGNDLNREKKQFAGKPKAGDNPMASESTDPLETMGRRLMAAYESIKVVDEGMVDKVKGMFGKKKAPDDGTGNLFNEPAVKADTKAYLKKSAKQPNGPDNVKNIFDK